MKKLVLMLMTTILMVGLAVGGALAVPPPSLLANGQAYDSDPKPYIENNLTMAPVGAICDLLGIDPLIIGGKITMNLDGSSITVVAGEAKAVINGAEATLPASVSQVDNYTYIPLRAAAEALGAKVTWNETNNSVDVISKPNSNQLIILNAGSLVTPLRDLSLAFNKANGYKYSIYRDAAGSVDCINKVINEGQKADLLVLADYSLFDQMMIPKYASWYGMFAKNEMVLCYRDGAPGSDKITADNWYEVLTAGARYGHTNPDLDPAGYRALMVWQLAEKFYNKPGLNDQLTKACSCPGGKGYDKADDLIADLKNSKIDYAFEYLSVAKQNGFKYINLPADINLADPQKADFYKQASVKTASGVQTGLPIVCGLAIPNNAPNPELAAKFAALIMGKDGQAAMETAGQTPIAPPQFNDVSKVPQVLKDIK